MKKENKKLAQERRAAQRKKTQTKKKISKLIAFWLPVIVIAIVIIVLIWAIATSGSTSSDTGTDGTEDTGTTSTEAVEDDQSGDTTDSSDTDSQSEYIETEGTVCEEGDTVVIDYSGSVDGEVFDGGTAENQQLTLGSGTFIDGFEDAIIGHTVGESFDINVTFPDSYSNNSDLAGKDATFAITIHGLYKAE